MTYCLGIVTKHGLIMASDSRTNAGYDQINTTRKMHTFVQPGVDQVYTIVTAVPTSSTYALLWACFGYAQRPSVVQRAGGLA